MVIDVCLRYLSEEEFVQGSLRPLRYDWYSTEYNQVLVTWRVHYPRRFSEMFCSAGARSCHKQSRHHLQSCRRSGAEVVCCTTQGKRRPWSKHARGQKGKSRSDHIRYRAHATLQLGRLRAGQSQITVAVLWYAPWLCLGLYSSERQRRVQL